MSLRSVWKGHLKVSLLTVPVKVYSAHDHSEKVGFNQLHAKCSSRINQRRVCLTCLANNDLDAGDLKTTDLLRGYEYEKGRFITISDAELAAVKVESTHTINISAFVEPDTVDPMLWDAPYYVAPESKVGFSREAFGTLRAAMGQKVGIGKVAIREREYVISMQVKNGGLVMHTLLRPSELRNMDTIEEFRHVHQPNAEEVALASQLVAQLTQPVDLASITDDYTEGLRKLIEAKVQGKAFSMPLAPQPKSSNNLLDALKASLQATPTPTKTIDVPPIPTNEKKRAAKATLKTKRSKVAV
jgi:DNA end-binding protein Ku